MKIYIIADMEGICGVVSGHEIDGRHGTPEQTWARQQFTREVRAVCDGARDAGAEEIIVNDFHGHGRNLQLDLLPPEVMLVRGGFRPTAGFDYLDSSFAGVFMLGAHTRTATSKAVLPHTYSPHLRFEVFGQPMGEFDLLALIAGERHVPVLLISGDDRTLEQAHTNLPGAVAVITKFAIGAEAALCIHPEHVCRQLKEETRRVLRKPTDIEPTTINAPIQLTIRLSDPALADRIAWIPGLVAKPPLTFEFMADSMTQIAGLIYGMTELVEAATSRTA